MTDVIAVIGAGSIGQAIARRVSAGKHGSNARKPRPMEGYRRLTFMMLDRDIVAVSPTACSRGPDCWIAGNRSLR
jgi:hypothetical protein